MGRASVSEKLCQYCAHYRYGSVRWHQGETSALTEAEWCALDRPLIPCEFFEREPGADDDKEQPCKTN
jgi:hypothetical protein